MVFAKNLIVGKSYIYIDNLKSDSETDMGKLLEKGDFRTNGNGNHEPSGTLTFENKNPQSYDWDDTFIINNTSVGGKRKSRRNRKSKKSIKSKSRKSKSRKNRRK
tara:strand:+ start:297 stop:611 length:315 start_codon:yes stop_codon:yes gene_type:complete